MTYYTDIITLDDAKQYLRVDQHYNADNAIITNMINAACRYVENQTNHVFFPKDIVYNFVEGIARVYDYPINTPTGALPSNVKVRDKGLYKVYTSDDAEELQLNVGYQNPTDFPSDLRQAALELIQEFYVSRSNGVQPTIPITIQLILGTNKRFVI